MRHYMRIDDPRGVHGECWELGCLTHEGGCGATVYGDSRGEAIAAWNRRADAQGYRRDAAAKRLLAAAKTYYEGYCQDEATEELDANGRGLWTGCDRAQRDAAIELREAVAAMAEKEAR